MNALPSVTIGITCFNAVETIGKCVESALAQNYPCFDIIIVDDCSTDGSLSILQSFSSPLVSLFVNTENLGCSSSRNKIINSSKSDIICFLDDDDISHTDRVAIQVKSLLDAGLRSNPYIVSMPSMIRKYPSGYVKYFQALGTSGMPPLPEQLADYLLFNKRHAGVDYGYCCPTAALMTSRKLLLDSGLFDPLMRRVEDNDIVLRFCQLSTTFIGVDVTLVYQSSTISSDKSYRVNLLSELRLLRKHKAYLLSVGMYRYSRLSTFLRFCYFNRCYHDFLLFLIALFLEKPLYFLVHYSRTFVRRGIHDLRITCGY